MKKSLLVLVSSVLFAGAAGAGSVSFKVGYYMPNADSDLWAQNMEILTLEKDDFDQFTFTVESDFFVGNYVNVCLGTGYYEKSVDTVDRDFVWEDNGAPIRQTLSLRIVPLEGSIKLYPAGRERPLIPYVGAGVGAYFWEYVEIGDFVIYRDTNPTLVSGAFSTETVSPGYNLRVGLQVPVGRSTVDAEVKYVKVDGDLSTAFDPEFEPFDLSGLQVNFGWSYWF
ncbi:MAG: hypothetical protein AB1714_25460 [Acidobacteriota bacterium]